MPLRAPITRRSSSRLRDSITAALFVNRFVETAKALAHVDVYGWTPSAKPARPEGGECQAARALYALLKERYGG
jgi:leucyl aminopeptidase